MPMGSDYKYFAFISYKREDEDWAKWLQHELEHYKIPAVRNGKELLPDNLRPVFRDVDELSAGNLPGQIYSALAQSKNLIVICSRNAARSVWVNKEIRDFIQMGEESGIDRSESIFPFIVDGTPHAKDPDDECFPETLRDMEGARERIGGNVNESGRDAAFVKTVAGALGLSFAELWNRYEREKIEEEMRKRRERDRLLLTQSRFLSEKGMDLIADNDSVLAGILAVHALPKRLDDPDERPYCPEAEKMLRLADQDGSMTLNGDLREIDRVLFGKDNRTVYTAAFSAVGIWDGSFGNCMYVLTQHENKIVDMALNIDGNYLYTASHDHRIIRWDVRDVYNSDWYYRRGNHDVIVEKDKGISGMSLSPDGRYLAYSVTLEGIEIMDLNDNSIVKTIDKDSFEDGLSPYWVTYSPDGRHIAARSWGNGIIEWNAETLEFERIYKYEDCKLARGYNKPCYSRDGSMIATINVDEVIVWDTGNGETILVIDGHRKTDEIAFCPDNRHIVVSDSTEGTLNFYLIASGEKVKTVKCSDKTIFDIQFDHTGSRVMATAKRSAKILNVDTIMGSPFKIDHFQYAHILKMTVSPDRKYFATSAVAEVDVYDALTNKSVLSLQQEWACAVCFSPDNTKIATAEGIYILDDEPEYYQIRLWDLATGQCIKNVAKTKYPHHSVVFSNDGKLLMSASGDLKNDGINVVQVWDVDTCREVVCCRGHKRQVDDAIFSPDNTLIASRSFDWTVRIWDAVTGALRHRIRCEVDIPTGICFSPDGTELLVAVKTMPVKVYDVATGEEKRQLESNSECIYDMEFSRDGKYVVATLRDRVLVWEYATGKQVLSTISGDGSYLTNIGYLMKTVFSQDGRWINAVAKSGHLYKLPFRPLQELIDLYHVFADARMLTPEEKERYYLE